jgi:hypothetical protein
MQTIFVNAIAVRAWLGEASADSDQAMNFIGNMSKHGGSRGLSLPLLKWLQKRGHSWQALISL